MLEISEFSIKKDIQYQTQNSNLYLNIAISSIAISPTGKSIISDI